MKHYLVYFFFTALLFSSCYYDKKAELFPNSEPCDTTTVTYSNQVRNIINGYCVGCHYSGNPTGYDLDTWSGLSAVAGSSQLMGAVKHEPGYSPMPPSSPKLDDCKIRTLQKWVDAGAPNN